MSSSPQPDSRPGRSLHARRLPLAVASEQLLQLDRVSMGTDFREALSGLDLWPLRPTAIEVLQINLGKLCNQTCSHCHVDAGPDRTEIMSRETAEACVEVLRRNRIPQVDITGGAPELNPNFRWLIQRCAALGLKVTNRCNLTILETGPHRDLPEFFAEHRVELVCSLPHYKQACTDAQRGDGVFEKSIRALRRLNARGYGDGRSGLRLILVTNPVGAVLPAAQACLEIEWKRELHRLHGISFDALYTITNMPISRYLDWLIQSDKLDEYMSRLVESFNPQTARGLMCRNTISVGWDGRLFDCDFNQMLEIALSDGAPPHIRDFDLDALKSRTIQTNRHCFGCTAGSGSSCTGATA